MNGHRQFIDLLPDYRSKSHAIPARGHRGYLNPTVFKRANAKGTAPVINKARAGLCHSVTVAFAMEVM